MPKNIVIEFSYVKFINSFVYNILSINVCSIPVTTWKENWILYTLHFIYEQNTTVWCQYVWETGWRIYWTGWVSKWAFIPLLQPSPYPATPETDMPPPPPKHYNENTIPLEPKLWPWFCIYWHSLVFTDLTVSSPQYVCWFGNIKLLLTINNVNLLS